jgi:hypothetical protein
MKEIVAFEIVSDAQIAEQKKYGSRSEKNEKESADNRFLFSLSGHMSPPED